MSENIPVSPDGGADPWKLLQMMQGYWITQALYVAAKLGIADLLREGPVSSNVLAGKTSTHPQSLYRTLRALASVGVFTEVAIAEQSSHGFAEAALETPQLPPVHAAPSPVRILVVDDDPLILRLLRASLEAEGHVVATANGGQEGIDAFRLAESGERFDIVMADLGMPRVDGYNVALAVKATRPSVPVILLTGWGQRLMEDGEARPCVDRVLSKPPKLLQLRATLKELIASPSKAIASA